MVLVQRGWWELVSQRWTCLSWEQVTNCSMEGWMSRPHSSSVWPWNTSHLYTRDSRVCKFKYLLDSLTRNKMMCSSETTNMHTACVRVCVCVCTCTIGVNVSGKAALMMAFLVVPMKSSPGFPSARARTGPNDSPTWTQTQTIPLGNITGSSSPSSSFTFLFVVFLFVFFFEGSSREWLDKNKDALNKQRMRLCSHLHLSLFSVVVAPQHHLAVLPSSRHQGAVLQDTNREDPALVGCRHLLADAVTTWAPTQEIWSLMLPLRSSQFWDCEKQSKV